MEISTEASAKPPKSPLTATKSTFKRGSNPDFHWVSAAHGNFHAAHHKQAVTSPSPLPARSAHSTCLLTRQQPCCTVTDQPTPPPAPCPCLLLHGGTLTAAAHSGRHNIDAVLRCLTCQLSVSRQPAVHSNQRSSAQSPNTAQALRLLPEPAVLYCPARAVAQAAVSLRLIEEAAQTS